nr:MAG: EthD family reductase [Pseudomonadota bacterium]
MYPTKPTLRLEWVSYLNRHIPLVRRLLGSALKGVQVERGISGGTPGSSAPFFVLVHLTFDSLDAFQAAFGPHAAAIQQDIPNYSSVTPIVQVSEVTSS